MIEEKNLHEKINIRKATKGDFNEIFSMQVELLSKHMTTDELNKLEKSFNQRYLEIIQNNNSLSFVVELEDTIAGFISGAPPLALWNIPERKTFVIEEMVIRSNLRSKGIGKKLLEFLIDNLKKIKYKKIAASSNISRDRAHNFYLKNGFEKDEYRFSKKI